MLASIELAGGWTRVTAPHRSRLAYRYRFILPKEVHS